MEPKSGYTTTEGALALLGVVAPIGGAILKGLVGWQLVVALGIAAVPVCVYIVARTWLKGGGPPPSGAAAVAALLVLLLAAPARAGGPESTPRAPMPADIAAAPAVPVVPSSLIEAARVQAIVSAALESAQRGVATLPPSWMDSKAGQVLIGCIAGAIVITSAAGAGIGAGLAFGK